MLQKITVILLIFLSFQLFSQEEKEAKNYGKLSGQWRSFYMLTDNTEDLKDYNALATGGHLKYKNNFFKDFEIGAALYTTWNLGIQDLTVPDEQTQKTSRYEEGLFDRLDLEDHSVFILGELYASYQNDQHFIKLGRMKFNSPLVNGQDGRMIPSLFQGVHYAFDSNRNTKIQMAAFNFMAPRSTGEFFKIGRSLGTYPIARNNDGDGSQYDNNNTDSDFLLIANIDQEISKNLKLEVWNYFIENVSNSFYLKPTYQVTDHIDIQGEWLHQTKINNGGNKVDSLSYFQDNSSDLLGLKIQYNWFKKNSLSLAYNRILPDGKFLFPREWGREFIFTFQKRERSEGVSDNHALVAYYDQHFKLFNENLAVRSILSLGKHWNPSVLDPASNKYAMPDYTQVNIDLFFFFKNWKNLKPEILLVQKFGNGDIPDNPNLFFNKVDMFQLNFVLNYNF